MPTEDLIPPSIKPERARLRIFGDTMLDHFITTNDVENFDRKNGRVMCVDRGWFLGGTARLAAYFRHVTSYIHPDAWYHSPALSGEGFGIPVEDLPSGPTAFAEIAERLQLRGDQTCTKTRILNAQRLTEVLRFLSMDQIDYDAHHKAWPGVKKQTPDPAWYEIPLTPTQVVLFSDYNKGAIDQKLIDYVLQQTTPDLVIYDGYNLELAHKLASNRLVKQLIIKGSYIQWDYRMVRDRGLSVPGVCKRILNDPETASTRPIIILSRASDPVEVHTSVSGLSVQAACKVPYICGDMPISCTNGAGDLLTASLVNLWMQLPQLDFSHVFESLHYHLKISTTLVEDLLVRRQRQENPFLEPWHIHDSDSDQAVHADAVSQSPVPPGSAGGSNPS